MSWFEISYSFLHFFELGGFALVLIAVLLLLLWILITERYIFVTFSYPKIQQSWVHEWRSRGNKTSWQSRRIRQAVVSEASLALTTGLPLLKALVVMAPMVGLLGTVSGMIQVFDTLSVLGTGNARAMAEGISRATIPTMAGMVVALPGLYFYSQLNTRFKKERKKLLDQLKF